MAREGHSVIGIAPLMEESVRFLGKPIIRFVGTPICDYMDFIIREGKEFEVTQLFYSYIKKVKCLEIDLIFLREDANALKSDTAQSIVVDKYFYIDLDKSWETLYNSLNRGLRQNVSRRERNLGKLGRLEYNKVEDQKDIDAFLKEYFCLHIRRWRDRAKRYSQFQYGSWRDFVKDICHTLFPKGYMDLSYMKLDSNIKVAAHVGFIYNKIFHHYMPTYNPDYSTYGPGNLLIMNMLKESIHKGLDRFDFLRGTESYKTLWTNNNRDLFNAVSYPDYFLLAKGGRLLRAARDGYLKYVKERLKKIMPLMRLWYKTRGR